jgi:SAM-dependent methyltransferase
VYDAAPPRANNVIELLRRLGDRDRLRFFQALPARAKIIEVGAGDGRLLAALRRRGADVTGIEPSEPFATALRLQGLPVIAAAVEQVELEPASVDAVVLWHVLEHLDDPAETLGQVRRWLHANGSILVAVPNLESLQARLGRDRWFHQDIPRHRTLFTRVGLERLLQRSGMAVVQSTTLTLDQSLFGMWQTLLNLITEEPNVLFRALKRQRTSRRDVIFTTLAAPLLAPVATALELGAGLAGHGGSAVVRAVAR